MRWSYPSLQGAGLQCSSCGHEYSSGFESDFQERCTKYCLPLTDIEMGLLVGPAIRSALIDSVDDDAIDRSIEETIRSIDGSTSSRHHCLIQERGRMCVWVWAWVCGRTCDDDSLSAMVSSIPIGWMADRSSRARVLLVASIVWCVNDPRSTTRVATLTRHRHPQPQRQQQQ